MTLHATQHTVGRPRRPQSQHHLPPLLVPAPALPSSSRKPFVPSCVPTGNSLAKSMRGSFSVMCNHCSVGVASGAEAGPRSDVVSYALAHQLPRVLNDMFVDLLRERPEDVDGWMLQWFEDAVERRRRQQTLLQHAEGAMCNSSTETVPARSTLRMSGSVTSILSASGVPMSHEMLDSVTTLAPLNTTAFSLRPPPQSVGLMPETHSAQPLLPHIQPLQETASNMLFDPLIAQRSLPPPLPSPTEARLHSAGEDHIIVYPPRGLDVRCKPRPTPFAELHLTESSKTNSL